MPLKINRNNRGFTIIEIVVVMVLIGIIAAVAFTRSITTDQINLVGQVDKIRQHIRYAQSMAMKGNRDEWWGIESNSTQYWLFKRENYPDGNITVILPGEETANISLPDLGVGMNAFTVYFNYLGEPWKSYYFGRVTNDNPLNITISTASESRTLNVTPETGLIVTQ
jgi:prepilin-type N-terminal cleavage/methylation domain-containing protein